MSIPSFTLNNGVEIPVLGFGGPEPEDITRENYGITIPEA